MSIRNRLLLWLLSALLVASTVITAATYIVERIAIRDSENNRLKRIALAIPADLKKADLRQINVKLHHGPDDFALQIWDADATLIYQSQADLSLPRLSTLGFSTAIWGGERWKVYIRKTDTNTIQVAQSLDARKRRVNRHALHAIVPPLLVIPLFGLFIPLCLNRGLKSLAHFSQQLESRSPHALGPLSAGPQPAEIVPLKSALDTLLQRLSQASNMQRTFIADASHELRTPLATLQVQTQLVEQALGTGQEREALADLKNGIKRTSHLLEQLLMASRLESNGTPGESHDRLSLDQLAREVTTELVPFASSRRIDLGLERMAAATIAGCAYQLRLLIRNLIDNAIRYTPCPGRVDVEMVRDIDAVHLIVEDSGPGIPVDQRDRVFDRFYRCLGHELPGSGLGLAIVKQVADRHGATIALTEGERLRGLKVTVSFQLLTLNTLS
ncbi:MAG TPA: ATP-binding protein [Steroidobacteraceae bacterium]|nr:ATP-binding protein [Steroidobacteraceae bacterium]